MNPNVVEPTLTFELLQLMLTSSLPLALFNFNPRDVSNFAIPIVAIIGGFSLAIVGMYFNHRRREQWHETARLALQKGQPLPPQVQEESVPGRPYESRCRGRNDLRKGIILLAVSAGLYFLFSDNGSRDASGIAAIPGFIGLALIVYSIISGNGGRDRYDDRAPRP